MLVSNKYKFVFLCTPKNASNSVEYMLAPYSEISFLGEPEFRHINVRNEKYISLLISEMLKENDIVKVALIRESVSWMYSWYWLHSRANLRGSSHLKHFKSTKGVSFETFIEGYLEENPPGYAIIGPTQFEFLMNSSGCVGVDELFLYEKIGELVDYMSHKVGKELSLKSKNVSPSKVYDSNLLEIFSYIKRKIKEKILRSSHQVKIEEGLLSNNLLERLKEKIPNDFELYEQARANNVKSNRNA